MSGFVTKADILFFTTSPSGLLLITGGEPTLPSYLIAFLLAIASSRGRKRSHEILVEIFLAFAC